MAFLDVQFLRPDAKAPSRGSEFAAGYDLYSVEDAKIAPLDRQMIETGIAIGLPAGTYGRIAPRSGLAAKFGIDVLSGVIDLDYTGEIKVILFNSGKEVFEVKKGDKIAQLILECILTPQVRQVEVLPPTVRGAGGFGSTGR